jgi:ADP-heptose:LPS heptosyltransferase
VKKARYSNQAIAKEITPLELRRFGLTEESIKLVDKIEDLRSDPPNIVIAECLKTANFIQNKFKQQTVKKKNRYVMGLGVYEQLKYEPKLKMKILRPARVKFKNIYKPYIGDDLEDETLMIWRTGGIGDLLFIQPNLNYLKELYPTCEIILACGPQYQAMIEDWPSVDQLLDLPFLFQYLVRADYHAVFEGVIERCKEARTTNAYELFTRWLGLDLPKDKLLPKQPVKQDKVEECKKILEEWNLEGLDFIIIQLRASSPIRSPRLGLWGDIINRITKNDHVVIITDAPHYAKEIDFLIEKFVKDKDLVFNFAHHSKSLDYTIALTSLAKMALSTDTAMMHLAAALDIKGFGLYGPFPGEIRLSTYPKTRWINAELHCAPCFLHGHKPCPNSALDGTPKCYEQINLDELTEKIEELYND